MKWTYKPPMTIAEARERIYEDGMPFVEGRCAHATCAYGLNSGNWRHDQCSRWSIGFGPDGMFCLTHARMVLMPVERRVIEPAKQTLRKQQPSNYEI